MDSPSFVHLVKRLDDLAHHLESSQLPWFQSSLKLLTHESLIMIGSAVDIPQVCRRLEANDFPTLHGLRQALDFMKMDFTESTPIPLDSAGEVDPHREIQGIEEFIEKLEAARANERWGALVPQEVIALDIERRLQVLLACYAAQGQIPVSIRNCVYRSLLLVGENITNCVWNSIYNELEDNNGIEEPRSVPEKFRRLTDLESTRWKIAEYITSPNPTRVTRLADKRASSDAVPGLAIMLTWQDQALSEHPLPSIHEQSLALNLMRVIYPLKKLFGMSVEEIAGLLRVRTLRAVLLVRRLIPEDDVSSATEQLIFMLRDLIRTADRAAATDAAILHWIRRYKLVLEATVPDVIGKLTARRESFFKRELCRFLLERNFSPIGVSFGTSEPDVVVTDGGIDYLIEVKVIRRTPTPSALNRDLVQLVHYISQRQPSARGILIIYNFTPTSIVATDRWLKGRYLILPINLHSTPPSRRSQALSIEPGHADRLIDVIKIGSDAQYSTRLLNS